MSGWYYQKAGMISDEQVGPLPDQEMARLLDAGTIGPDTLIAHPDRTKGQWATVSRLAPLMQRWQAGQAKRDREKNELVVAARQLQEEQRQVAAAAQAAQLAPIQHFVRQGQDPATILWATGKLQSYLTAGEEAQYIAVQSNPLVITPDVIALTSRRLIILQRHLLGQVNMVDYIWLDLFDARLQEGIIFATLWFRVADHQPMKIEYLPKEQARMLYRIAQEREEAMREYRRQRTMEETRAGASQIVINNSSGPSPAVQPSVPTPAPAIGKEDLMARLQQAKSMLEAGLIEQAEFNAIREKILAEL